MVSLLDSTLFESWAGPLWCVLGQYQKLSVSVSPLRCVNGTSDQLGQPDKILVDELGWINIPFQGRGSSNTTADPFCYRNVNK